MARKKSKVLRDQALKMFEMRGGILTTSEAIAEGIHPRLLYELRDKGLVEQLARGLYGLPGLPGIDQPDFVTVAKKVPEGVICLTSALYFHELTVQIPRWVDVAIRQKQRAPTISHPPVQFHWFSDAVFEAGVESHNFGAVTVRMYSKEKSIVDCFRLRGKVGISMAVEALKNYWRQGGADLESLRQLAKMSRVLRTMKPYIEAVIHDQS